MRERDRKTERERSKAVVHIQVVHKFSHIHYYCHCWHVKGLFSEGKSLTIECSEKSNWIDKSMLTQQPISTLVKKVTRQHTVSLYSLLFYMLGW